jgi:hypothetical protein
MALLSLNSESFETDRTTRVICDQYEEYLYLQLRDFKRRGVEANST